MPSGPSQNWFRRLYAAVIRGLNAVTPARLVLMVIILALIVVHGEWAKSFDVDGTTVGLILVLLVLILVPILKGAELPGGTKLQFKEELDAAEREAVEFGSWEVALQEAEPVQTPTDEVGEGERALQHRRWQALEDDLKVVTDVLDEAGRSPRLALIRLSAEIDRAIQELLAVSGWGTAESRGSSVAGIARLAELNQLPPNAPRAIASFTQIRNRIVHEATVTDEEILRAIDIGITILRSIQAVPRERHFVYATEIPLFGDESGASRLNGYGVMLESVSSGGASLGHRIFPTTRDHFRVGMQVTWEWDPSERWGATWYRDPDSGAIESAWDSSVGFAGTDLASI